MESCVKINHDVVTQTMGVELNHEPIPHPVVKQKKYFQSLCCFSVNSLLAFTTFVAL